MNPGPTAFTRIPRVAFSSAAARVRPITPCLEATYADEVGIATWPRIEARLMITPPSPFSMAGICTFMA